MNINQQLKIQAMYSRRAKGESDPKPEVAKPAPKRGKPRKATPNGA